MLTRRGFGVLALAVAFYAGARLFGTFELYLMAFGFLMLVGGAWLWTLLSARGDDGSVEGESTHAGCR